MSPAILQFYWLIISCRTHAARLSLVPSGPLSLVLHFNHAVINTFKLSKNRSRLSTFSMLSASAPVPRPSASLIVVNAHNEVLLVHRNPKARAFGGMTVCHIESF